MEKIKSFTDLIAWQKGHILVLSVYEVTDSFSQKEVYGLTSQMRRSAISITSNIAEGFSRNSFREKIQFYYISLGSVTELHNQIIIAKDLKYIDGKIFSEMVELIITVSKLTNGLIKSLKLTT